MKSKKADFSITLLTIMTFILCLAGLLMFATSKAAVEKRIGQASELSDFYSGEEIFRYNLFQVARTVVDSNPQITTESFVGKFQQSYLSLSPAEYLTPELKEQILNNSKYVVSIESKKTGEITQNILHVIIKQIKYSQKQGSSDAMIGEIDSTRDFKADFVL